jgi:hypothetical protein
VEGLVWRPEDWPGATGVKAMLSGKMKLEEKWLDLSDLHRARQRGESTSRGRFVTTYTLELFLHQSGRPGQSPARAPQIQTCGFPPSGS